MKYKSLGATGIKVSELCFGTMSFGGDASEEEAGRMFRVCRDRGINFFDCADVYVGGKSEEILGRVMAGERDDLVITSKCHGPTGDDINARGANRRHIVRAVEASLKRLNTDRIDVLFMHRFDNNLPLEETLRALEYVVQSGKVLHIGASNYAAWQVAKALGISERRGWSRIDVIQPMYSLVKRQVEVEILPMAQSENVGVISYSPNGAGLLSGKYGPDMRPNEGRLVANKAMRNAMAQTVPMKQQPRSRSSRATWASTRLVLRPPGSAAIRPLPLRSSAPVTSSNSRRRWTAKKSI